MYTISITNYYCNYYKVYSLGKEEEPKCIWASVTLCTTNRLPSALLRLLLGQSGFEFESVCDCVPPDNLVPYSGYCWDRVALSSSLSVTVCTTWRPSALLRLLLGQSGFEFKSVCDCVPPDDLVPYSGYCWDRVALSSSLSVTVYHLTT